MKPSASNTKPWSIGRRKAGVAARATAGAGAASVRRVQDGFTLVEVLAALAFMAIVVPVAVEGLRVANAAGQSGLRKTSATRIADQVLNEWIAAGQSQASNQRGSIREGVNDYQWTIRVEPWNQDTMRLATAEVIYLVQGRDHDVRVSTLIDNSSR